MKPFSGVTTALATPFSNGKIDERSLEALIKLQLSQGVQGFVVNGTTGECPTLNEIEREFLFSFIKKRVPSRFPLIMGAGSNSTLKTIEEVRAAEKMAADAVLVVVPYYNRPPQKGLFEHFAAVAGQTNLPIILYNVPGRTIVGLELETIKKLSALPNIVGIKEASGNINFAKQIREACGQEFVLLTGDDETYEEFMRAGGDGAISVASHLIAETMLQKKTTPFGDLIRMLFAEVNPIPLKMALHLLGIFSSPELRLPLVEASPGLTEKLKAELKRKGLLK